MSIKKVIFAVIGIGVMVFLAFKITTTSENRVNPPTLTFGGHTLKLEVVNTPETRSRGLGNHAPLSDNEGMFFIFEELTIQTFWMKDMTFPIDVVWLSGCSDGHATVAGMEENIDPQIGAKDFELKLLTSPEPVRCVLEVRGGLMNAWNVHTGDSVSFASNLVK